MFVLPACLLNRIRETVMIFLCGPLPLVEVTLGLVSFSMAFGLISIPGVLGLTLVVVPVIYSLFFRIEKDKMSIK